MIAIEVHLADLQERFQDMQVLAEISKGSFEVDPQLLHAGTMAGPNAQPQTPGRQLLQHPCLLGHNERVAGIGGDDRRAELDPLRLSGRCHECGKRVEAHPAGGHPGNWYSMRL